MAWRLQWASTEAVSDSSAFILDLDLSAKPEVHATVDEALQILRDLKTKEGRAFEGILRDRLTSLFHGMAVEGLTARLRRAGGRVVVGVAA